MRSHQQILNDIASADPESLARVLITRALEWAIAGFIEEAILLRDCCNAPGFQHPEHRISELAAIQMLFTVSGEKMINPSFTNAELQEYAQRNWDDSFYPSWHESYTSRFIQTPLHELTGYESFVKAISLVFAGDEKPDEILQAFKSSYQSGPPEGYNLFQLTTVAALYAARHHRDELAEYFVREWGAGYLIYPVNYTLSKLAIDYYCARLLINGLLAPVFKFTKEQLRRDIGEIQLALKERSANGPVGIYKHLSWKQLLGRLSRLAFRYNRADIDPVITEKKTLLRSPATKDALKSLEERLNTSLPADYKKFLLSSNGLETYSSTGVTLSRVDQVGWLRDIDAELISIWTAYQDDEFNKKFIKCLVIGGIAEEQMLLLVLTDKKEWECWFIAAWLPGEWVFRSFRQYIEDQLRDLESK